MNVLFLTLCDFKDIKERWIYTDLIREFIAEGHHVTIVSPRESKYKEETQMFEDDKYKVLKVKIGNIQKTNLIERGISTLLLEGQVMSAVKRYFSEDTFNLVLYSTPPITFSRVIGYFKKKDRAATYLMLKDIFPQNAVDMGVFGKCSLLYWYFRYIEKKLYKLSDYIGCMSEANVEYILHNNLEIAKERVEVCPNSITPLQYDQICMNKFEVRKKNELPVGAVVFMYGGNFGIPQGLDYIIKVLIENHNKPDRHFVFCGTGTELYRLKKYVNEVNPTNVTLIGGLPKEEYDELLSSCDVGLIFLDNRFTIPNFPSRMLSYMEFCLPVLAAIDKNTDLGKVIINGNFGWWCESKKPEDFTHIVDYICAQREVLADKGKNARKYLEEYYTARHTYEIIMKHFDKEF